MKKKYEIELQEAVKETHEVRNVLKQGKQCRPFLIGEEADIKVQNYLRAVRLRGC